MRRVERCTKASMTHVIHRERERERERQTDRQTDAQTRHRGEPGRSAWFDSCDLWFLAVKRNPNGCPSPSLVDFNLASNNSKQQQQATTASNNSNNGCNCVVETNEVRQANHVCICHFSFSETPGSHPHLCVSGSKVCVVLGGMRGQRQRHIHRAALPNVLYMPCVCVCVRACECWEELSAIACFSSVPSPI